MSKDGSLQKTCTKCGEDKPLDEFNNEIKRTDGKYPWCKPCLSLHRKTRYVAVPRRVWIEQKVCSKCKQWKPRDQYRKYAGDNLHYRCTECEDYEKQLEDAGLTECSTCGETKPLSDFYKSRVNKTSKQCTKCHRAYHRRDDIKLRSRESALKLYFGITLSQYEEILEIQDHKCPVCLKPFEDGNYSYPVDHAHSGPNAGAIRAILHDRCNRFVVGDHVDPEQLRRAADLIESPLTNWFVPEEFIKSRKRKKKRRSREEYLSDMAEQRRQRMARKVNK